MDNTNNSYIACTVNRDLEPFTYFYWIIFLVGFFGSCFALWAFNRKDNSQKCTSVYLINLLVADLLLTLALPFKIVVDLGLASWKLRIFHCQVTACMIYINMYISIIFLGFVSMDRCLQTIQSAKLYQIQKRGFATMLSVVVWALVLAIMLPNMLIPIRDIPEQEGVGCIDFKQKIGKDWHVLSNFISIAIFLNCSCIILISNCITINRLYKNKDCEEFNNIKTAFVKIFLITAGYIICFLPYHIVRIPYTLSQNDVITDCSLKQVLFHAKESTLLLSISNLCFDPIVYFYFSKSFRTKVTKTFSVKKEAKVVAAEDTAIETAV
ncbi:probable G-protein coupled receptor 171 [Rana temporaria]|uniref:probable G-protein coupled receptor 171 n=1 Tax=Rana temporaria TaxID=8407 RepID=UPI001AADAC09|nr:probable G-protein coupled receptor 171 [Rana temporaria]XP_040205113.1 probable G-protein coupled receptor 171 [Rana temporaria]XP_040205114.1 probable G-protein coupled receptor 171 [Rana temporaria]XP_040205116.1 probable G-protein coupled receptor 171 [Rana temporaria]XP_040205117.1 probable G-protein coupled receptor 171 [Rana temporaria]